MLRQWLCNGITAHAHAWWSRPSCIPPTSAYRAPSPAMVKQPRSKMSAITILVLSSMSSFDSLWGRRNARMLTKLIPISDEHLPHKRERKVVPGSFRLLERVSVTYSLDQKGKRILVKDCRVYNTVNCKFLVIVLSRMTGRWYEAGAWKCSHKTA